MRSARGGPAQQRGDPVIDQLAHDESRTGALHAGDAEDLAGHAVQIRGVGRDHMDEQVGVAGDPVHLEDLGDLRERMPDLVEPALCDPGGHERGERVAEGRGGDAPFEGLHGTRAVQ